MMYIFVIGRDEKHHSWAEDFGKSKTGFGRLQRASEESTSHAITAAGNTFQSIDYFTKNESTFLSSTRKKALIPELCLIRFETFQNPNRTDNYHLHIHI